MYGVPTNFPISQIVGELIEQVCIGENDLVINMSNNKFFLIQGPIITSEMSQQSDNYKDCAQTIMKMVGDTVVQCNLYSQSVEMVFHNYSIKIIDDSKQYESFVFEFEGGRVVV